MVCRTSSGWQTVCRMETGDPEVVMAMVTVMAEYRVKPTEKNNSNVQLARLMSIREDEAQSIGG